MVTRKSKSQEAPLAERLRAIVDELKSKSKPGGRDLTKDEIDEMWGHDPDEPSEEDHRK